MKVIVASAGKFHALRLAEQLAKRGHLHKLITTYYSQKRKWLPALRHDNEVIPPDKVITNFIPLLVERGMNKLSKSYRGKGSIVAGEIFDAWAMRQMDSCDLVVAWSGLALHTLRRAKEMGAVTVVERGSSHILFQKKILEEEYSRYGIPTTPVQDRTVAKELDEYQEADYICVPSKFAARTFLEKGVRSDKLIQVPFGTDLSRFNPSPKSDQVFRVIHCGGLTLRKGVHYLLQAFFELNLPNSELWLVGSWSSEISPFFRKYDNGKIFHKGSFAEAELAAVYSQGSLFCLGSIEEGLALVILQAMACALPVITTTNSGAEDLIDDGKEGFIIPIRDVAAFKEKILFLYEHEKNREIMGGMALAKAKRFSWDSYGEKIEATYRKIIDRRLRTLKEAIPS